MERRSAAQAKFVVEAANGPTTPGGDAVLRERGIVVLPDIYTNGGASSISADYIACCPVSVCWLDSLSYASRHERTRAACSVHVLRCRTATAALLSFCLVKR